MKPMPTKGHPLVVQMRELVVHHGLGIGDVTYRAGLGHSVVSRWSQAGNPTVPNLEAVLGVMGYRLAIVDAKTGEIVKPVRPPGTSTNTNARGSR